MAVDEHEEKTARRDVTKWACSTHNVWRDNPDEYAEIIAREFRHGLRIGVHTGTRGMPVGCSINFSRKIGRYIALILLVGGMEV